MQKYLTTLMVVMLIWLSCGSDSAAPEVQITNPIAGSIVTGLVDITISASDNEGLDRVVLYINNSIVETFTSEPYSYLWATESLPDSSLHDLLAKAYDINENEGVSETVTVTVSNDSICGSVYIWNYDPFDKFYDPEIGDTVDCAYRLEQALLSAGYGCEKGITLPVNLNNYDLIFVTLGWFRCWGDNSIVAPAEQLQLVDFLNQGKGLYIEGCDFGYNNGASELYRMFGCIYSGNGNTSTTGNINTINGQVGSIAEGMTYAYLYQQEPDNNVDHISADSGTIFYECQDAVGRAVNYSGSTNSYRAIHSTFIFGALRDGINTKQELMQVYLDYLSGGL